jgi:FkbM family methyltransferase
MKNMSRQDVRPPTTVPPLLAGATGLDQTLIEAIDHHHAGRAGEAETIYRAILGTSSGHAVASYGFGMLCATQGRLREAVDAYRDAIATRPGFVEAYINLGAAVLELGEPEEAADLYRQAVAISPDNALAHGNLGKALQDLGRIDEAIGAYRDAIALQPDDATFHANLGAALLTRQEWNDSAAVTRRAIALRPGNAMAHANLGAALLHLNRREEALAECRQAIASHPQGFAIHASLGGAMLELGASSEAIALCREAIAIDPTRPSAWFNLSHAFKAMNNLAEAACAARQAIALCPDSAEFHFHLAHILLLQGDLDGGWVEYDWRWKLPDFAWIRDVHGVFSQPLWTGEDIGDKTILIYTEQGLGDIILFARYLPLVVRRARRVIVAAHPSTRRLLESIDGISIVSIRDVPLPDFDVHCPLLSLPRAFATRLDSIPGCMPYLSADPSEQARWNRPIDGTALRVGIVWAGNPATKRDHFRSPGLTSVMPIFSVPGIDFIVLQVGTEREDRGASPLPPHVTDLGGEVTDLADTAAIMSGLDLMISSCTAPLHLAGALGLRTWAMIPFAPYFPWLLDRTDTPWYSTMRLYRQDQPGRDWSGVVGRIADDLAALVRSIPSGSARVSIEAGQSPSAYDLRHEVAAEAPQVIQTTIHRVPGPETEGCNELALCRGGPMLYNRNDTYIGASLRKYGEFSGEETELFRLIVQPGRTVLDVGANIGVHTVELSRLAGPAGVVHAFEPQRHMFQLLCANVALNSCTNVFTHQAAAGAGGDTMLVPSLDPGERHNYGGLSLLGSRSGESVPLVTIDSLILHDCQFIKLDVEGMETEALRGAVATIRRFRPMLYVENDRQAHSEELIALLQSYDYRLYWHLPPLFRENNFRADTENIFGRKVSVNMICIPAEIPQSSLTNMREVTGPTDHVIRW